MMLLGEVASVKNAFPPLLDFRLSTLFRATFFPIVDCVDSCLCTKCVVSNVEKKEDVASTICVPHFLGLTHHVPGGYVEHHENDLRHVLLAWIAHARRGR